MSVTAVTVAAREVRAAPHPGSLYATLLGRSVWQLAPSIAELHCGAGDTAAHASLRIAPRRGLAARLIAVALRLPKGGAIVATRVHILRGAAGETWVRCFGDAPPVRSHQYLSDGLMVERFGRLELSFAVTGRSHGISFEQRGAAVLIGRRLRALPPWLAPRVSARVVPRDDLAHVHVSVELPLAGRLLAYDGVVFVEPGRV